MTKYTMRFKNGNKEVLNNKKELTEFLKYFELGEEVIYDGVKK